MFGIQNFKPLLQVIGCQIHAAINSKKKNLLQIRTVIFNLPCEELLPSESAKNNDATPMIQTVIPI